MSVLSPANFCAFLCHPDVFHTASVLLRTKYRKGVCGRRVRQFGLPLLSMESRTLQFRSNGGGEPSERSSFSLSLSLSLSPSLSAST
jgi:hypothetical protein